MNRKKMPTPESQVIGSLDGADLERQREAAAIPAGETAPEKVEARRNEKWKKKQARRKDREWNRGTRQ